MSSNNTPRSSIMPDAHNFIGVLAQALHTYDVQIRLSTLSKILRDKGAVACPDGFDIGSIVAAAFYHWLPRDAPTATAIAFAFRGEDGEAVIAANEQTTGASLDHSG